mmetsp:Transcript_130013/g.324020  ORF Transcript_130013/g.324020 Transcript_130013/m.324020 type:complete len:202 (-) Transcript_130013:995-1600(-)
MEIGLSFILVSRLPFDILYTWTKTCGTLKMSAVSQTLMIWRWRCNSFPRNMSVDTFAVYTSSTRSLSAPASNSATLIAWSLRSLKSASVLSVAFSPTSCQIHDCLAPSPLASVEKGSNPGKPTAFKLGSAPTSTRIRISCVRYVVWSPGTDADASVSSLKSLPSTDRVAFCTSSVKPNMLRNFIFTASCQLMPSGTTTANF